MFESTLTLDDVIEATEELSPDDQLRLVSVLAERLSREVRWDHTSSQPEIPDAEGLEQATALYEQGQVTLARAAEMASLTRWELMRVLKARGAPVTVEVPPAQEMDRDLVAHLG